MLYLTCDIMAELHGQNNTHKAAIALLPSTMYPESWAEAHIHIHTAKSFPSASEEYKLASLCPSTKASCRSSAKD